MKKVLIIDKNETNSLEFEQFLKDEGYSLIITNDIETGLGSIKSEDLNVVLIDEEFGLEGLKAIKDNHSEVLAIIIRTDRETVAELMTVAKLIVLGAFDVVRSPIDTDSVKNVLEHAFRRLSVRDELFPETIPEEKPAEDRIVGNTQLMIDLGKKIGAAALSKKSPVLIEGESGTGKGMVARVIHKLSERKEKPFITINCGAVPDPLLENELFGHIRGAFTDAKEDKKGAFEEANGGTLFLDEVANMSRKFQVKLQNALEDKEIKRVGDTKPTKVDVRVITGTNQDLEELIKREQFREDLYYRFDGIKFHLPPLRERKEDIPLLVTHFLQLIQHEEGKLIRGVSKEGMKLLQNYEWPGNVRELERCLSSAVSNSKGDAILPEYLPLKIQTGGEGKKPKESWQEKVSEVIPETPYTDLFDLPVMVFCQFISGEKSSIIQDQIAEWSAEFSNYGREGANKAKLEIDNWNTEWSTGRLTFPDLLGRIKEAVDNAISQLSNLRHGMDSKPTNEAEPISIIGRTHKGSLKGVLHEIVKEYGGDIEKAAAALNMGSSRLKNLLESGKDTDLKTSIRPSRDLKRFPDEEIRRLLTEPIISFVVEPLSRKEWRDKTIGEQIRTVHLALKVTSRRLAGDHGCICFGGMTFEQIQKDIYWRAPYLYSNAAEATKALDIDIRTFKEYWADEKAFPSHYTLFTG